MRDEIKRFWLVTVISVVALMGASCFSNQTTDPNQLVKGNPVTKNIVNDEVHSYAVKLEKGLFVGLAVEQHDVDIITKVFAPNGELIGEFDTPTSRRGTEKIRFATDATGDYRIDIYTLSERAESGEYKLEIADYRRIKSLCRTKIHSSLHFERMRQRAGNGWKQGLCCELLPPINRVMENSQTR